jgi:aminopeptidase N
MKNTPVFVALSGLGIACLLPLCVCLSSLAVIVSWSPAIRYEPSANPPETATALMVTDTPPVRWTATPGLSPVGENDGSAGIGDPYFPLMGNGGYDVHHYDLDIAVDMELQQITAVAVIDARSTEELDRFNLDFTGLTVQSVKVNGVDSAYKASSGELTVTPAEPIAGGTDFTVRIAYGGRPLDDPTMEYLDGWSFHPGGVVVAGEPTGAENWFPVNNHPSDKATYSITITVAEPYIVASNGVLEGVTENGDGTRSYTWVMDDPMASYLATVAIGTFDVIEGVSASGIPIRSYVDPDLRSDVESEIGKIPEIIDYYETVFGPYPFDACGVVVHELPLWFALENQTLVVLGSYFDNITVVHELAHQWFGDSISLEAWQDIWLNEGFASYAEALWREHTGGRKAADADIRRRYEILAGLEGSLITIGDPGPEDLFNKQVYDRGALTLHALRLRVGDDAFFRILRTYVDRYGGGNARTEDFITLAEEISSVDLEEFFRQWLYETTLPDIPEMNLFNGNG